MTTRIDPPHRKTWSGLADGGAAGAGIGILGVPFDGASSSRRGSAAAPDRIRSLTPHVAPFTEAGAPLANARIHDYGNVELKASWKQSSDAVEDAATKALRHPLAVFLGGDHAVTIPLFAAAARVLDGPIGVIHLDAHLDLMDSFEGRRWSHACTARRILDSAAVSPAHYAFVGTRSWLDDERAYVADHPEIAIHTAQAVFAHGALDTANAVCRQLAGISSTYVTIDIDVLDPAFAPGTGTPEAGGLSTRDLLELLRIVFENLPVRAVDLVEVSPPLDSSDITSFAAIKLIYESLGWTLDNKPPAVS